MHLFLIFRKNKQNACAKSRSQKRKKKNALTFDTTHTFAIISAVSEARFKSEEYMAAGLASLDRRRATLQVSPEFLHKC
jgi:hypothetical protein